VDAQSVAKLHLAVLFPVEEGAQGILTHGFARRF
jgi:hypothetical protein